MRITSMFFLLSAWTLIGATASAQTIDGLAEGTSATVLSLNGGVTLRDLDQGLGTAPDPFVIDDASSALLNYDVGGYPNNNVVSFGGYVPGGDNLYGQCKSFRLVLAQPTTAVYFTMWLSRAEAGNSIQLDYKRNGQTVSPPSVIPIPSGTAPFCLRLNPINAQGFDEIIVSGIGPNLGGAFHGVIDGFLVGIAVDFIPNCDGGANLGHTPCPCGNDSNTYDSEGCSHSFGYGGRLRAAGNSSISADTLQLVCMQLPPNAPVLFFQGTMTLGNGLVFGDGLRCAGGSIRRLAVKQSQNGIAYYPEPGDAPISVQGQVPVNSVRTYQAWYRNAGPFCSSLPFNLSNGWAVGWSQ